MAYQIEVTDTFGGEANYCWVRRERINPPEQPSRRSLVRQAKAFAGWTGLRADVSDIGDMIEIRPRGLCQICFVTWED
jgi:hypothetical protein